ncbi:RrF2 family transcriptional regulator [Gelidibacter salicanalis]|uniref:Rrf2 family transcriptional regulator n=1 Tax=Gelidibacter salicanalis TaxID=291193 RepID=A0A934NKX2_9FLAO|nr:Rrf2 family transcriptional regulator [Gelidibacter salicanalis]MBJ7882827.1 Rrf2 family transcriptional regulator [Gelidibacter salicanalis]
MFSKSCEYGLRAVIFIAQQSHLGHKASLTSISQAVDSPPAFTAKILQQLAKNNLIDSSKGPKGGFFMAPEAMKTLTLEAVVTVLDGDSIYTNCGLGLKQCNDKKPCPLHFKFVAIKEELKAMLQNTTLIMLVNDMNLYRFHLKR